MLLMSGGSAVFVEEEEGASRPCTPAPPRFGVQGGCFGDFFSEQLGIALIGNPRVVSW